MHTLYGDKDVPRRDVLLLKCLCCKGKKHVACDEFIGESEEYHRAATGSMMVRRLEGMTAGRALCLLAEASFPSASAATPAATSVLRAAAIKCVFDNPNSGVAEQGGRGRFRGEYVPYHPRLPCGRTLHRLRRMLAAYVPQGIPLHLLNRKFIKDIDELYGDYQAGAEIGQRHPLDELRPRATASPPIVAEEGRRSRMKKLSMNALNGFFAKIAEKQELYLPIEKAGVVNFYPWTEGETVRLDALKTVTSPPRMRSSRRWRTC